jgi:group I intron endonuclease
MASGIYRITVNGKRYIGSAADIRKRWFEHIYGLRLGNHANAKLQNSYNKYGEASLSLEVLFLCPETELRLLLEEALIHDGAPELNICKHTASPRLGVPHTEETRRKLSLAQKGKPKPKLKGRLLTNEHRQKLSEAHKGQKRSPEAILKSSMARRGVKKTSVYLARRLTILLDRHTTNYPVGTVAGIWVVVDKFKRVNVVVGVRCRCSLCGIEKHISTKDFTQPIPQKGHWKCQKNLPK